MRTPTERNQYEFKILGSRFIGVLLPISSGDDVSKALDDLRKEFPKATHYCYAWKKGSLTRTNDDGEPAHTAGRPLLSVIEGNELDECLLVAIRYFGGTKLGVGRLQRSYVDAGLGAVSSAKLGEIVHGKEARVKCRYDQYDQIRRGIEQSGCEVLDAAFDEFVELIFRGDDTIIQRVLGELPHDIVSKDVEETVYIRRS